MTAENGVEKRGGRPFPGRPASDGALLGLAAEELFTGSNGRAYEGTHHSPDVDLRDHVALRALQGQALLNPSTVSSEAILLTVGGERI